MHMLESERQIRSFLSKRETMDPESDDYIRIQEKIDDLMRKTYTNLTPYERVMMDRAIERPKSQAYIQSLFTDFKEFHGDRYYGDDAAIIGGIGWFEDLAVTVLAQAKGRNTSENVRRNFGMVSPEGYRKVLRLAKQAEKFHRPIIQLVDTSGAYPGKGAEERGQAQAIAQCLYTFSDLRTPIITIVISEGGSGGALAMSVADSIYMLENAVYSILSPEGFASILWKDGSRVEEAAQAMKMTSNDLQKKGIVDVIIREPLGGAQKLFPVVIDQIKTQLDVDLKRLVRQRPARLVHRRQIKYRKLGAISWK